MLPRYPADGPSSRLRMLQYIPALETAGATVKIQPFFDNGYLKKYFLTGKKSLRDAVTAAWRRREILKNARFNYDLIWIEKEVYPFLPSHFENDLVSSGVPYVLDYDDATFHNYDLNNNIIFRWLLSHKLDELITRASAVIVGNSYLGSYIRRFAGGSVVTIPTVVDLNRYPVRPFPVNKPFQLGWIGTPNNARYLELVVGALKSLKDEVSINLITVGANGPAWFDKHVVRPWRLEHEGADVASFDAGIMPIPDEPWERGKCGYKLIQYLAGGRPVIASPVGVNREIVTDDVGFLATHHDDWSHAIMELVRHPELKIAMGKAARLRVETHYSLAVTAPQIINVLQQAVNR